MLDNQTNTEDGALKARKTKTPPNVTKLARLEAMLRRPRGATQEQLENSLEWQPHTIRAAISRLRKSGAEVLLDRSRRTPTYRISGDRT
ncbi:DUF3489 domain-containing protein [Boseongicola aestuarii]|uniref:DUF3489 domain-containing protein n=1 Tax=Boseongicola aestuarii TaxID=1470561 RepID=A0A238J4X7_9RHOB|nr:DUF3489 domain-containing protein [Boseongicola aestuarii]SMX25758.1 hypothetical protein BOA8489_03902 [Boseongicola aestuarii]